MATNRAPRPDSNEAIGDRLKMIRRAYSIAQGRTKELNKSEFPRLCGIGVQAWHNAETGLNRIGLDNAMRVRERTGVGLEYIYFGVRLHIPEAIATAIDKIEQTEKSEKPRATKRAS